MSTPASAVVVTSDREGKDQTTERSIADTSNISQGAEDGGGDKGNEPKRPVLGDTVSSRDGSTYHRKGHGGSSSKTSSSRKPSDSGQTPWPGRDSGKNTPKHVRDSRETSGTMSARQAGYSTKDDVQIPVASMYDESMPESVPGKGNMKYSTLTIDRKMEHASTVNSVHTTHIQNLQAPRATSNKNLSSRNRLPPKHIRIATVGMDTRARSLTEMPSLYFEDPHRSRKVITWDQANNARPPLRIDMEGPTPWTYSPRNKPLYETNAPSWTFGSRCSLERDGGSRTSWAKSWFQSPHVWNYKVDFLTDTAWPPPNAYRKSSLIGQRQTIMHTAPAYTVGKRSESSLAKQGSDTQPSPADYDLPRADTILYTRTPAYTHQFRRDGTILWASLGETPGPGAYTPTTVSTFRHQPAFSIQGIRREKSHLLGPYSSV